MEKFETLPQGSKDERYALLYKQVVALVEDETDMIANMANVASMIQEIFAFLWTGFYRVADAKQLVLGPFQGPLACTRIPYGKGVCGTAWAQKSTLVVPDVEQFPGHIACSSDSRSEIVVPVFDHKGEVIAVLDIDSTSVGTFDETDKVWLERISETLLKSLTI